MYTLIICLLIAVILPYLAKLPLAIAMHRAGGYNNNYPREQAAKLSGFGARASAAHNNSFEALAVFSTAVLAAIATNNVTSKVELLAMVFIALRVVYHVMYLMNLATLRSLVWTCSYVCCVVILCQCIPA